MGIDVYNGHIRGSSPSSPFSAPALKKHSSNGGYEGWPSITKGRTSWMDSRVRVILYPCLDPDGQEG